jgi:ComF family protein
MAILESILKTLAPHNCLICSEEGDLICVWCGLESLPYIPSRCYNCYSATTNSEICKKCRRLSPLKHVWVRTEYEGVAKQLIHTYKFSHARSAAGLIAQFTKESLPYFDDVIIVPIPTATTRVRQRGFDHALLIAKNLAQIINLPYDKALRRTGQTKQLGTKRTARKTQLTGAFRAVKSLKGQHILLVDDVVTTGATLEEAARVCRKAGAKTVDAVVFTQRQ